MQFNKIPTCIKMRGWSRPRKKKRGENHVKNQAIHMIPTCIKMRGWSIPRKKKRGENHVKNPGQGRPKKKTVEEPRKKISVRQR
jgi:hypothetical protein